MSDLAKPDSIVPERNSQPVCELSKVGLPQWFALAVGPGCDEAVAGRLQAKGFQTFLPTYKRINQYPRRSVVSEVPLFPGYVFCRFNVLSRLPIIITPGVIRVLGYGNNPVPVAETEMSSLQTAVNADLPLQPFPFLQVGQRIRIEEGVLAGVEGVVIEVKASLRLVLSITLLRRSVVLVVGQDEIGTRRVIGPAVGGNSA